MLIETLTAGFRKARSANSTDASYPSRVPVGADPVDDGVIVAGGIFGLHAGVVGQSSLVVVPYCTGSNNDTFSVRVVGWRLLGGSDRSTQLWVPVTLCELACTASAVTGVAGRLVAATERFADTLTITKGNAGVTLDVVSPANDTAAHALIDAKGFQRYEFLFALGTAPTDMNALVALL